LLLQHLEQIVARYPLPLHLSDESQAPAIRMVLTVPKDLVAPRLAYAGYDQINVRVDGVAIDKLDECFHWAASSSSLCIHTHTHTSTLRPSHVDSALWRCVVSGQPKERMKHH